MQHDEHLLVIHQLVKLIRWFTHAETVISVGMALPHDMSSDQNLMTIQQ